MLKIGNVQLQKKKLKIENNCNSSVDLGANESAESPDLIIQLATTRERSASIGIMMISINSANFNQLIVEESAAG